MSNDDIKKIASATLKKAGINQTVIKDKTYTIKLLPATQALAVAVQLFKVALPAMGAWADGEKKQNVILPEDDNMYTEMAVLLVRGFDSISVMDLVGVLSQNIQCDGSPISLDEEFKGNLAGLLILLEFILKENCGPFFKDWLAEKGISLPSLTARMPVAPTTQE